MIYVIIYRFLVIKYVKIPELNLIKYSDKLNMTFFSSDRYWFFPTRVYKGDNGMRLTDTSTDLVYVSILQYKVICEWINEF